MRTVLIAGHAPAQNQAWQDEFAAAGDWDVLGPVRSFTAARVLLHRHNPDLVMAELRLHDGNVLDMIRVIRAGLGYLRAQILVIGGTEGEPLLLQALQEGADNFHDPAHPQAEPILVRARDTLAGGADIAPWIARRLLDHFECERRNLVSTPIEEMSNPLALTPAERFLLRQLALGRRMAEIARVDKVRPRELAAQVRAIYRKMQWDLRAGDLGLQVA